MRILLTCLMLLAPVAALAEEVVAGLSQTRVSITTNFDGSEILIFGAVKRETAIADEPLNVIITVSGPSMPTVVRKKDRRFGIWVNTESLEIDAAPSFYAVTTSAPWEASLSAVEDLRHQVSVAQAIRSVGAPAGIMDAGRFADALIRIREDAGLYQTDIGGINLSEETLFDTSVRLPANLTEGAYVARFLLTRGGAVIDVHEEQIDVRKVGLERFLFNLSRERPLAYGLMSLAIAIFAGWSASAVFRYIRS
jgi:uncharacterized protein (TIGR02186 family)